MKDSISPILNNPYEEPRLHYDADIDGNLDYTRVLPGRRPYAANVGIVPNRPQSTLFGNEDVESSDPDAPFINAVREEVGKWRRSGYPRVTRVTRELLNFWFENAERPTFHRLFFCQREAVETAVYLNEVADTDPNMGRELLRQLEERRWSVSSHYEDILPRTAFKMATGTGKTVVMAMLILYNYINRKVSPQDTRFADHFLVVTPGITIRDRLAVLYLDESQKFNDADKTDYYHRRGLIPPAYRSLLGGLNTALTITNYHQFEPKVFSGKKSSPLDGKLSYCSGEGMVRRNDREDYGSVFSRLLSRLPKSRRILVINDEAHHCYLPHAAGKGDEAEQNAKAMVWYEGLRRMKELGYRLQHVYDLSATPYHLPGSGYEAYSLFPWTVSDFGLVDAIESGLVKIPFLPSSDNSHGLDEPKLRNIYDHISRDLPSKGQRRTRREAREEGKASAVDPQPNLPALLTVALEQFVKDYEDYERGSRLDGEAAANLLSAPPVFIVVCNNTTVSKEVFRYIAGYETVDAEGRQIFVDGRFAVFSNYRDGIPLKHRPSLLIDSEALDNASGIISDDFRQIYAAEIAAFKRDYAQLHGAGSADALTETDILREVVNSVGRSGSLGGNVRCVVSVSMLTEGWDANTVTHVLGVRAFGSQLLCEQVAGRALRRRNYDLLPYNAEGEEIEPRNLHKYKPENVVWKFPPEYAHIIGVPFRTFRGGGAGTPPPPVPRTQVYAMKERSAMEIRFPNVTGYRHERLDGNIVADYTDQPKFRLNFNDIPTETILRSAIAAEEVELKIDFDDLRDAQVIYMLTRDLIHARYTDRDNGRQFQKFPQLKKIVEQWYRNQIEIVGGDLSPALRRMVVLWKKSEVVASIYAGIHNAGSGSDHISAILNYYNPEGSTAHVHGSTSKPVMATVKSHVNYVVADTAVWEQLAAKTLEELEAVQCYVKNHFLNFRIPYMHLDKEKDYLPDFIARVTAPSGQTVNLIIEISGWSNDDTGHKDAKRYYASRLWVPAVNNLRTYGRWDFIEVTDIDNIKLLLLEKINSL